MAKTQFTVEQLKTEAVKPLFAVAGATELAVELARGYATEAQKLTQTRVSDVQARVSKVELEPKALQAQARSRVEDLMSEAKDAQTRLEAGVAELQKEAKDLPAKFEARLNEALEELNTTYADLQVRGEKFVRAIRKDGVKAVTSAKPVATERLTRPASETKTTATKTTGTKTTGTKTTAKKASTRKVAAKKTATKTS